MVNFWLNCWANWHTGLFESNLFFGRHFMSWGKTSQSKVYICLSQSCPWLNSYSQKANRTWIGRPCLDKSVSREIRISSITWKFTLVYGKCDRRWRNWAILVGSFRWKYHFGAFGRNYWPRNDINVLFVWNWQKVPKRG